MSLELANKTIAFLQERASMLARVREFFALNGVMEVDTPVLSTKAPVDLYIDLVSATCCGKKSYLHSSPEYAMKRLIAMGIGDIYQLSHVFRDSEVGGRHNPEFTMCEWYRMGGDFEALMEETLQFIRLFLDVPVQEILTYEETFLKYAGKSPSEVEDQDHVLAFEIEPKIGRGQLTIICDFPASHAALSKTVWNGREWVAKRFEVFYLGMELANGYHELTDAVEQKRRLEKANLERKELGKPCYPIDDDFVQALQSGMPECCGVAVGFDRLMMLRLGVDNIKEVIPFPWV